MQTLFTTNRVESLYQPMRALLEEHIWPHEMDWLKQGFATAARQIRDLRPQVKASGGWNLYLPENLGGPGLNLVEVGQLSELLGRSPFGHYTFNCQAPDAGNIELLMHYADDEIKERFLEPLVAGDIRSCFSMTEPHFAGSNPVRMGTLAVRDGDDYIINGHKWFTTAADGAAFAIVMAITAPEAENPYTRASMFVVPTDTPGFNLVRNIPIMGHPGEDWLSHAEIRYENVRIPARFMLGPEGAGFRLAQERLGPGRIHHCMRWIGIAERSFELMCQRAATRELKAGKMLGQQQMVQQWIAESRAEIDAARLLVLHAARQMDELGAKAARNSISAIKFFTSKVMNDVVDRSLQVHGALGITDDTILSFFYREERGARIYDGTDETHKASLARNILKEYGLNPKR